MSLKEVSRHLSPHTPSPLPHLHVHIELKASSKMVLIKESSEPHVVSHEDEIEVPASHPTCLACGHEKASYICRSVQSYELTGAVVGRKGRQTAAGRSDLGSSGPTAPALLESGQQAATACRGELSSYYVCL